MLFHFLLLLFYIALEKVVQSVQRDDCGIDVGTNKISILDFADDFNIIGNEDESIAQNTSTLINGAKSIGLTEINIKTKVMELSPSNNHADRGSDTWAYI